MIPAVGAIGGHRDEEYMRILRELMALGISPSGNIFIDKYKLNKAKQEQNKEPEFQLPSPMAENEDMQEIAKLEESRLGATKLGELKKLLLGL